MYVRFAVAPCNWSLERWNMTTPEDDQSILIETSFSPTVLLRSTNYYIALEINYMVLPHNLYFYCTPTMQSIKFSLNMHVDITNKRPWWLKGAISSRSTGHGIGVLVLNSLSDWKYCCFIRWASNFQPLCFTLKCDSMPCWKPAQIVIVTE